MSDRAPAVRIPAGALAAALLLAGCGGGPSSPPGEDGDGELDRLRAENAVAQGRHDWARIYYRRDHQRHPERVESLRREGLAWLSGYQQSLSEGTEVLRRYLELRPDDAEAARRLVSSLLLLGEWSAAREWADRLGDGAEAHRLRAEAALEADPEAAREAVGRALEAAPEDPRILALAARVAERAGEVEAARRYAERAVRRDPFDATSFYLLGRLARRQGDLPAAREALEIHQLLRRLQHDGTMAPLEPEAALEVLGELRGKLPAETFAVRRREVTLLFEAGRLAAATDALESVAADPEASTADLLTFATLAGEAGRTALSRRLFERVLEADPENRGAVASLALLDLEAGRLDDAGERLDAALARDPHFARYRYLRGLVARARDRPEAAREHLERAVELAPWEWPWRRDLADLLLAVGDEEGFRRAVAGAPEETPAVEAYRRRHARLLGPGGGEGEAP